ncbi:MAG: hypothetical protein HQ581_27610 [Planctomycetes bacterium]|nr:hypothetical protein [Planctomycetota bacterium]
MLTKQALLGLEDLPTCKVELDEWAPGEHVFVRTLTAHDLEMRIPKLTDDDAPDVAGHLVAFYLCDESGNRMCPDTGDDTEQFERDAASLARKNPAMLKAIVEASDKHNGVGQTLVVCPKCKHEFDPGEAEKVEKTEQEEKN